VAWRDAFALVSIIAPVLMLAAGWRHGPDGVAIRSATGSPENPFWWLPMDVADHLRPGHRHGRWPFSGCGAARRDPLVTTAGSVIPGLSTRVHLFSSGTTLQAYLGC